MDNSQRATASDSRRILLVIEDDALAELLEELLTDAGHQVARAIDVRALEPAEPRRFHAIIVDLDMRAHNGLTLLEHARRAAPGTTVVALLPCGGMPTGERVPCHLALEKPARLSAVLSAVRVSPFVG